jgi:hypothetical protein
MLAMRDVVEARRGDAAEPHEEVRAHARVEARGIDAREAQIAEHLGAAQERQHDRAARGRLRAEESLARGRFQLAQFADAAKPRTIGRAQPRQCEAALGPRFHVRIQIGAPLPGFEQVAQQRRAGVEPEAGRSQPEHLGQIDEHPFEKGAPILRADQAQFHVLERLRRALVTLYGFDKHSKIQ